MCKKNNRQGILIDGKLKELVGKIARATEEAGGWRNWYTEDSIDTMQVIFLWNRLRDTSLGALDIVPNALEKRIEKWSEMLGKDIEDDDILQIYHGVTVDGLVYSNPMIRFRVTPDNNYYLLDYETDFAEEGGNKILQGDEALPVVKSWLFTVDTIYGFLPRG